MACALNLNLPFPSLSNSADCSLTLWGRLCLVHVSSLYSQNGKRICTPRSLCCKRSHLFQRQHKHPRVWWHIHHGNTPSSPLLFTAPCYRRKALHKLKTKDQTLLEQRFLLHALHIFNSISCVSSVAVVWTPLNLSLHRHRHSRAKAFGDNPESSYRQRVPAFCSFSPLKKHDQWVTQQNPLKKHNTFQILPRREHGYSSLHSWLVVAMECGSSPVYYSEIETELEVIFLNFIF